MIRFNLSPNHRLLIFGLVSSKYTHDSFTQVFDQGLKAISLSVDLWLHYINHCKVVYEKDEDKLRAQYERAIQACGLEFRYLTIKNSLFKISHQFFMESFFHTNF